MLSLQKDGKRHEIRKPFDELSLAEARLWGETAKQRLAKGEPIDGKSNQTFAEVFLSWHDKWKIEVSLKYGKQVKNAVIKNVFPTLEKAAYLLAIKQGQYMAVHYVCPSADFANRLSRLFDLKVTLPVADERVKINDKHRSKFAVYSLRQ